MKLSLIILTGLSGAGKTIALRSLEDCGYFCTDNLPPQLINEFIEISKSTGKRSIAIGIDIREKSFLEKLYGFITELKQKFRLNVVFLEANKDVLLRRFKETRRPHPLSESVDFDIEKAIDSETEALSAMRDMSDRVIDTSTYSPHHLRSMFGTIFCPEESDKMHVSLTSFGFKFGVPQFADMVFDVRFLPNPYFVAELKELTGKDEKVKKYVMDNEISHESLDRLREMIRFLIPQFLKEGKSALNICVGCTGGRHRSVVITEELSGLFNELPVKFELVHREL
ncbi:MAG: RNase adapter RapZ [Nitrospirota bacterium]|nr:MAG: RNase adapter RapZ [Nitrospirota bacterium]